jgi:hypothetical protein
MSQRLRDFEIVGLDAPEKDGLSSPFLDEALPDLEHDDVDRYEVEPSLPTPWHELEAEASMPGPWHEFEADVEWDEEEDEEEAHEAWGDEVWGAEAETEDAWGEEPWLREEAYGEDVHDEHIHHEHLHDEHLHDEVERLYDVEEKGDFSSGLLLDHAHELAWGPDEGELASGEELEDLILDELLLPEAPYPEHELPGSVVTFPSGVSLSVASAPSATESDEYYDPHRLSTLKGCSLSRNPLLDTSAPHRGKRLSEHFTVDELTGSGGKRFEKARVDPELVRCLQAIRDRVGKAVRVTSGYRSWGYNRRLYQKRGKTPTRSQHCSGRAVDIKISGMSGLQIARAAIDAYGCDLGLGVGPGYAHVDLRGCFTVWTYASVGSKSERAAVVRELRRHKARTCASGKTAPPSPARGTGSPSAPAGASRAVLRNRYWGRKLGWSPHYDAIARVLGFTDMMPGEQAFAEAVAGWQRARGLTPDGIVGPKTWAALKASVLGGGSAPGPRPPAPGGVPALGGPKVAAGFRAVKRKGKPTGLARYGGGRLDAVLVRLRREGRVEVTDQEIDVFQRIAHIETGGQLQAINTWDSAVVSTGFMQFTLQHGKVQEWIRLAAPTFKRYGIELDPSRTYQWGSNRQAAIKGAGTKAELRWDGWAERFYLVGLDDEAVVAEVKLARQYLLRHLQGLKRRLRGMGADSGQYDRFMRHYGASGNVRGMFQASFNNLPAASAKGVRYALQSADADATTAQFETHLKAGIKRAFSERGLSSRGVHHTTKTLEGARL